MRKIAILLFAIVFGFKGFAQDDVNESKNFRLGLHFDPYITWYSPVDQKKFDNGGTKMKFSLGAVTDFKLGGNVWLSAGASFSFLGGAINYLESNVSDTINSPDTYGYFLNNDNEIIDYDNVMLGDTSFLTGNTFIQPTSRNYKVRYLTIPLNLKIKTKEIGYLTYFGQFGVINHIKLGSVKIDDEGAGYNVDANGALTESASPDLTALISDKEPSIYQVAVNLGGGAEYNISGSTSLFASIQFNYGLNSAIKNESEQIIEIDDAGGQTRYNDQKFNPHAIVLRIGVLF